MTKQRRRPRHEIRDETTWCFVVVTKKKRTKLLCEQPIFRRRGESGAAATFPPSKRWKKRWWAGRRGSGTLGYGTGSGKFIELSLSRCGGSQAACSDTRLRHRFMKTMISGQRFPGGAVHHNSPIPIDLSLKTKVNLSLSLSVCQKNTYNFSPIFQIETIQFFFSRKSRLTGNSARRLLNPSKPAA